MKMIVTVSNEYGSGAFEIANRVAATLGYALVDRELPVVVAKRLHTTPESVEAAQDPRKGLGERFLHGLAAGTPELSIPLVGPSGSFDEACLREVETAVREHAAAGNVVIFGRAANAILGRRADVLRLFIHAPREWRIALIVRRLGLEENIARAEVERIDAARRAYAREHYGYVWGDPSRYDLSLDSARLGVDAAVEVIVAAVRFGTGA